MSPPPAKNAVHVRGTYTPLRTSAYPSHPGRQKRTSSRHGDQRRPCVPPLSIPTAYSLANPSSVSIPPAPVVEQQLAHASSVKAIDELLRLRKEAEEATLARAKLLRDGLQAHKERLLRQLNDRRDVEIERLKQTVKNHTTDLNLAIGEEERRLERIIAHTTSSIKWLRDFSKRCHGAQTTYYERVLFDEYQA